MGKRGPRPTPKAILKLRGSWRGADRQDDPQPERGRPDGIEFHDETESKNVCEQMCASLDSMGLLHRTDWAAIERYCRMFVRWRRVEAWIEKYGDTYPINDKHGKAIAFRRFPQVTIAHELSLSLAKMEAEFGLTPSSRSRISVNIKVPKQSASQSLGSRTG